MFLLQQDTHELELILDSYIRISTRHKSFFHVILSFGISLFFLFAYAFRNMRLISPLPFMLKQKMTFSSK